MARTRARTSDRRRAEKEPRVSRKRSTASRANGKKGGRPKKPRDVTEYRELGPPPPDTLDVAIWMHKVIALMTWKTITDESLTEDARRSKTVQLARAAGSLTPKSRLRVAEKKIRAASERKAAPGPDAPLEKVPKVPAPKVPGGSGGA